MAKLEQGGGARKNAIKRKNQARAAALKAAGVERTNGRCALCYRIITVDGPKSVYRHICKN
jgi:hypothetical protein